MLLNQLSQLFSHFVSPHLSSFASHLRSDEEGADMAEYALVLVLIAIVAIAGLTPLGTIICEVFGNIVSTLSNGANAANC